ncbi:MAG: hypothetical protein PF574_08280 [Candidatus Delongbacteria bacterium]|jgi:hypothetical protein|nr:hypothetical protein [Candidatus Delongbacteria bacterium]
MKHKFIYEGVEFDSDEFSKLSKTEQIHKLLPIAVDKNYGYSINFIENDFNKKKDLLKSLEFMEYCIPEVIPMNFSSLSQISKELESVLNHSKYLAFTGFYKESIIELRSALELSLIISMFYLMFDYKNKNIDELFKDMRKATNESNKWFFSNSSTPSKGNFKEKGRKGTFGNFFYKQPCFKELIDNTPWEKDFNSIWNDISNYTHSNGIFYMSINLSENYNFIPIFNKKSISLYCNYLMKTLQLIGVIAVVSRPELINKEIADDFEHLGEPLIGSGLWGKATEIFYKILPPEYLNYFKK